MDLVNSLFNGAHATGSLLYRDAADVMAGASWLCAGSGWVGARLGWCGGGASLSATPTLSRATWSITNGAAASPLTTHDPTITGTVGTARWQRWRRDVWACVSAGAVDAGAWR